MIARALTLVLALAAAALAGPGCATAQTRGADPDPAARAEGTGVVVLDLRGIRKAADQRPEGVHVRLHRIDTDQDLFAFTDAEGPTRIEHLPPGRYEVSWNAAPLGVAKTVRGRFSLVEGKVVRVILHDGRAEFLEDCGEVAEAVGKGALVAGKAVLYVAAGAAYVAIYCAPVIIEVLAHCH